MSLITKVFSTAAVITATTLLSHGLHKKFPPKGNSELHPGQEVEINGNKRVFIGYFGGDKQVIENKINYERVLFYGCKKVAQQYAKCHSNPHVGIVVGDKLPTIKDHDSQWFEGSHDPLSPSGMKRLNVSVHPHEDVNHMNEMSLIGAIKRAAISSLRK